MNYRVMLRGAVVLFALVVASCSSERIVGHDEQNGFSVAYSEPFIVDHLQPLTIKHASDLHETLVATLDRSDVAGLVENGCQSASLGANPTGCLHEEGYAGDGLTLLCDDAQADWVCTASIYGKAAGTFVLTLHVGSDSATFRYLVEPQHATKVQLLSTRVYTQIGGAATFFVRLIDQLGAPIRQTKPSVVPLDTSVLRVTSVEPTMLVDSTSNRAFGWGDSVAVTVIGLKPGVTSVRVELGSAAADVPIQTGATADDSAIVMSNGKTIDVLANDAAGISNPRIVVAPNHASASVAGNAIQVVPLNGYLGLDSLMYVASAVGRTDTAKVRLAMMPGPYAVSDVVDLPATATSGAMNDSGQVYATVKLDDGTTRAVRWTASTVDTLQYGGSATTATGMDASGTVVGMSGSTAILWRAGSQNGESILGNVGSGTGPRISTGGTIILNDSVSPVPLSFRYNHFVVKNGAIEQRTSAVWQAVAVDDAGDYVGLDLRNSLYPNALIHYANGSVAGFGGRGTSIGGMNNHAAVVLNAGISGAEPAFRPMLYDGAAQAVLSKTYKTLVAASQINDNGWISGVFTLPVGGAASQPGLIVGGAVATLQSLLADQSLLVDEMVSLSNSGRILARVHDANGSRLVVLTPTE